MAAQAQEGLDELLNVQVRRFDGEEIPLLQSKALCWSIREEIPHVQGKRNPTKMVGVARGHQRTDTLKPKSQKTSQSDHTDHSLV